MHLALPPARCTRVLTLHRPSPGSRGFPGQAHDTRSSDSDIYCMSRGRSSDSIQVQRCVCLLDCFWPTYLQYIHMNISNTAQHTDRINAQPHTQNGACVLERGAERTTDIQMWVARYSRTPGECDPHPESWSWSSYLRPRPRPVQRHTDTQTM